MLLNITKYVRFISCPIHLEAVYSTEKKNESIVCLTAAMRKVLQRHSFQTVHSYILCGGLVTITFICDIASP